MVIRYLDPKADLTFKKIFGEHKDLVISFLNAMITFEDKAKIESVEYLSPEMIPDTPMKKYSIVDVMCKDEFGRLFIVEMQMIWTPEFKERILRNTAKAYSNQLPAGVEYGECKPVYSLCLINEAVYKDDDEFYHHFVLTDKTNGNRILDGLNIIFIELPKFKADSVSDRKMQVLWLRFLTEINESTFEIPSEFTENKEISKALEIVKGFAFSDKQMLTYYKFWDTVAVAKLFDKDYVEARSMKRGLEKGLRQGLKQGIEQGIAQGIEQGIEQGIKISTIETAKKMLSKGIEIESIADITGLSTDEILSLRQDS